MKSMRVACTSSDSSMCTPASRFFSLLRDFNTWLWTLLQRTHIHIDFAFFAFLCPLSARRHVQNHMYRTIDNSVHSGVCAFVHVSDLYL